MIDLTNKTAVVTGGGRGIGRGVVESFLEAGARVVVAQRSPLDRDLNGRVMWVETDLQSPDAIGTLVDQVVNAHGGIDIVVNNAGIMFESHVRDTSLAQWSAMMSVNVTAPFLLSQAALASMEQRGGGAIINIGSIEGLAANPGHTAYCASKGAVHGMTRAMAVDLADSGVRVNAIAPGWIETDLVKDYVASIDDQESFQRELKSLHPAGRVGQPIDVGRLATFLASDAAGFITGQVFVIDGGRLTQISLPGVLRDATSG